MARNVTEQVASYFAVHREPIYRYLRYGCRCSDAEELTQEVFLRLYKTLEDGKHIESVPGWLYTVAKNLAINHSRSRRFIYLRQVLASVWQHLSDTVPDQSPTSEAVLIGKRRHDRFLEAMNALSPVQRQCLELRSEGLLYRQIAELLGMSVSGVAESVERGVTKLRTRLGEHAD